jgi:preprotein translocase subunit SecF
MPLVLFKTTPNINFLKYKYHALVVTFLIIGAGLVNVFFGNGWKPGVDFGGGTLIRVIYKTPMAVNDIRQALKEIGQGDSSIQEAGKSGKEFQIRTMQNIKAADAQQELEAHQKLADEVIAVLKGDDGRAETARGLLDLNNIDTRGLTALLTTSFSADAADLTESILGLRTDKGIFTDYAQVAEAELKPGVRIKPEVITFLKDKTFLGKLTVVSRETVGPQAGAELRRKATLAVIWSLIGMLVYIAFRFKLEYGLAAIFTLTQDVFITLAFYSFSSREINLPIIAAFLTIVGYSINDTIVIFDRVRENQRAKRKESLESLMNLSLNQCLGRTLITSGTVFLTVGALFLFGGKVINDFAFCMLIGTIEGVYSTIFMACPVVLIYQKIFPKTKGFRK